MRLMRATFVSMCFALVPTYCLAQGGDALQWLVRASQSAQKLSYTGVFTYQSGRIAETSRITHVVDSAGEAERLEVLDGSPREIVRINEEVHCYLPEDRTLIIERSPGRRAFPALLPASFGGGIGERYIVRKGGVSRVAGLESQSILIEPRDTLRYGHQWWVDTQSGLLLKASLIGDKGESIETFAFSELRIGGPIDRSGIKALTPDATQHWRIQRPQILAGRFDDGTWEFRTVLPGFRKVSSMKRHLGVESRIVSHWVFSDGLAAISVFIDPTAGQNASAETGSFTTGAVNLYKRRIGDALVVVMGDVPHEALRRLGDGIEAKK